MKHTVVLIFICDQCGFRRHSYEVAFILVGDHLISASLKLRVYSLIKLQQIPKVSLLLLVFLLYIKKPNVGLIEKSF